MLSAVFQSANDAIVCKTLDGTITAWNPAAQALFGYQATEAIGMNIRALIPPQLQGEEDRIIARVHRGEVVPSFETQRLHKDGSLVNIAVTVSPVKDRDGVVIGASKIARCIDQEIEARRQAEQYRNIIVSASDGIVVIEASQVISYANPAAQHLFGYSAVDLIGKPLTVLIPQTFERQHVELVRGFQEGTQSLMSMAGAGRIVMARHHGGELFPVEVTISKFGHGPHVQMTALIRDARAQLEAQRLRDETHRQQAANTAKNAFLARMSHELRTPVTVVMGFAELLERDAVSAAGRAKEMVQHIRSAGVHLLSLIDDLLDTARIESGAIHLDLIPRPVDELLDDLLTQAQPLARVSAIRLPQRAAGVRGTCVLADGTRMRQVIYNLLSNAIKYNRPEGTVDVEVSADDDFVRIDVSDTGIGISDDNIRQLFIPFNRLGQERTAVPGTGLGLSVAHDLVNRMGGRLRVRSTLGQGSTFTVELPRVAALPPEQADPQDTEPAPPADTQASGASVSGRLLCVDDNPVNRLLIDAMLADWTNLQLQFAVDGRSALEQYQRSRPDLMILDLQLPDGHGLKWLRLLRQVEGGKELPVIVFSASVSPEEREEPEALGARAFLSKPFLAEELKSVITETLRR